MPKMLLIRLKVPSGSRAPQMLNWLDKQLNPHKMRVMSCEDVPFTIEEAREVIALLAEGDGEHQFARGVRAGSWDHRADVRAALSGLDVVKG